MKFSEIITCLLQLFAGVGTFLVACETMSKNLQAVSSNKLKTLFAKVSNNKIIGVCIGALATAAIQSSGATNVMVMGFVNAAIITLNQAATIVFGTEIGTTLTGQIVALGMLNGQGISTTTIFASLIGVGAFIDLFSKKDNQKSIGGILIGFGMIFVGLSMMSDSMNSFAQLDGLKVIISKIDSVILMIIVGAVLTAVVQSSSAITSIAITMIVSGLITLEQGIYITLGANVGSCVTGAIAALTSSTNAKRVSLLQLIFNIGGVVLVTIIDYIIKIASSHTYSISTFFEHSFANAPQTQLAMFHTIFNIASVIIVLPFTDLLVKFVVKVLSADKNDKIDEHLHYFDYKMMSSPSIAVSQLKQEIINMAQIAINNFNISIETVKNVDFKDKSFFEENEKELNYLNENLVKIVAELSKKTINAKDYSYLSSTYHAISDFERIGDYSENIMEYADYLNSNNQRFSNEAINEINEVCDLVNDLYKITIDTYQKYNQTKFDKAAQLEADIDEFTEKMASNHIKRMNNGECDADIGNEYLQLASNIERIADHLININDKDFVLSH